MNLIKLYTQHGEIYINLDELNGSRKCIRIYTRTGKLKSEVAKSKSDRETASFGVHVDNLFGSLELAEAHGQRVFDKIFGQDLVK